MSKLSDMADNLRKADGREVQIGWFESARYAKGTPVAQVAAWNEWGHTAKWKNGSVFVTPARPFMRATAHEAAGVVSSMAASYGSDVDRALRMIGESVLSVMQDQIKNGGWVKNSELTIHGLPPIWEGKGFDSPLTDSGVMAQTASYKVVTK